MLSGLQMPAKARQKHQEIENQIFLELDSSES
jgi:hypothetical protein